MFLTIRKVILELIDIRSQVLASTLPLVCCTKRSNRKILTCKYISTIVVEQSNKFFNVATQSFTVNSQQATIVLKLCTLVHSVLFQVVGITIFWVVTNISIIILMSTGECLGWVLCHLSVQNPTVLPGQIPSYFRKFPRPLCDCTMQYSVSTDHVTLTLYVRCMICCRKLHCRFEWCFLLTAMFVNAFSGRYEEAEVKGIRQDRLGKQVCRHADALCFFCCSHRAVQY